MDQALRTNIGNTNNLTTFLNDNAPVSHVVVKEVDSAPLLTLSQRAQ